MDGLKITLQALRTGLTVDQQGRKLLARPFVFQCPPLDEFKVVHQFTFTNYDTIASGQFTRWGSRQLRTWQFDTLALYLGTEIAVTAAAVPSSTPQAAASPAFQPDTLYQAGAVIEMEGLLFQRLSGGISAHSWSQDMRYWTFFGSPPVPGETFLQAPATPATPVTAAGTKAVFEPHWVPFPTFGDAGLTGVAKKGKNKGIKTAIDKHPPAHPPKHDLPLRLEAGAPAGGGKAAVYHDPTTGLPEPRTPGWYREQLRVLHDSGAPFRFIASYNGVAVEPVVLDTPAVLLGFTEGHKAGEGDAIYFESVTFSEFRGRPQTKHPRVRRAYLRKQLPHDDIPDLGGVVKPPNWATFTERHGGKRIPHKGPSTLAALAKHFYGNPQHWQRIAVQNGCRNARPNELLQKIYPFSRFVDRQTHALHPKILPILIPPPPSGWTTPAAKRKPKKSRHGEGEDGGESED